ncbi:hypothetical protein D3C80_2163860 [compost metagenome]
MDAQSEALATNGIQAVDGILTVLDETEPSVQLPVLKRCIGYAQQLPFLRGNRVVVHQK